MIRHGFTLIEFMTAVAIILVVMAISIPVFTSARRSAQVTSSVQMLRQLHLSAKLYQSDYQGDGVYGDLPEMGLPSAYHLELLSPTQSIYLDSPCGQNLDWIFEPLAFDYIYRPGEGGQRFAETSRLFRENLLLFYDVNCDDPAISLRNPDVQHFGIGILLSGQAVRKRAVGRMYFDDFWWTQPE
jgi:prepilin-type N-terminal cleavage/methylation domain-containing protein